MNFINSTRARHTTENSTDVIMWLNLLREATKLTETLNSVCIDIKRQQSRGNDLLISTWRHDVPHRDDVYIRVMFMI